MKPKSGANKRKLILNKISIAQLDTDSISRAKGGAEQKPTVNFPPCEIVIIDNMIYILDSYCECYSIIYC